LQAFVGFLQTDLGKDEFPHGLISISEIDFSMALIFAVA